MGKKASRNAIAQSAAVTSKPDPQAAASAALVQSIRKFNAKREPERLALKYAKMRVDAFAFMRGSCHRFYSQMPQPGVVRNAPLAWICGDLHLENFGSYKGDNRLAYFDINDFDEAVLAPLSWDVVRLLASIDVACAVAASHGKDKARQPGPARANRLCEQFLADYAVALHSGKPLWLERDTAVGPVRALLDSLRERGRPEFLNSRTEIQGKQRRIRIDGSKNLTASAAERADVMAFMATFASTQAAPDFFKVIDVARRVAGTGSLGLVRFSILVRGKGSPDGNYLLDLKEAPTPSLLPLLPTSQPAWASQAQRVVTLQQRMQAVPMAFLNPVQISLGGRTRPAVLRGLQASEDRLAVGLADLQAGDQSLVIRNMAQLTAWAHLRGAGRSGAADIDALMDYAQAGQSRPKLLATSQTKLLAVAASCAADVRSDFELYARAYDAGEFALR